jgi:rare lipoprotein A
MVKARLAQRLGLSVALAASLAACGGGARQPAPGGTAAAAPPLVGHYKVGQPYRIKGRWYRPEYDPNYSRVGIASWYGADFHGLPTANGEVFDKERISAAHPTLPLPSTVRVTNLENGRSMDIRVNDRGPFIDDRIIDLSEAAARELGYDGRGLARVRVDFLALADARGTPPAPAIAKPPRTLAVPALPARPSREVQLAALDPPAATRRRPAAAACTAGPQLVQIGAFGETDQVSAAMATVEGLERVRVEPAFAGTRAVARVRLGPVADGDAAARLLERVVALGYTDAFLVPAAGDGRAAALPVSC